MSFTSTIRKFFLVLPLLLLFSGTFVRSQEDVSKNGNLRRGRALTDFAVIAEHNAQNAPELQCDCTFHYTFFPVGGCKISKAPPANKACKCIKFSFMPHCEAELVETCPDLAKKSNVFAEKCKTPDKSLESCLLGGGECTGYN